MHWDRSGILDRGEWLIVRRAMLRTSETKEQMIGRFRQTYDRPA